MKARLHLGDGVYIRWDGYDYHLAVNHHNNEVIVLEPLVIKNLTSFIDKVKEGNYEPCKKDETP